MFYYDEPKIFRQHKCQTKGFDVNSLHNKQITDLIIHPIGYHFTSACVLHELFKIQRSHVTRNTPYKHCTVYWALWNWLYFFQILFFFPQGCFFVFEITYVYIISLPFMVFFLVFTQVFDRKWSLQVVTCFQLTLLTKQHSPTHRSSSETSWFCVLGVCEELRSYFCRLCRRFGWPHGCIVWEGAGSVCKVTYRWSHAKATYKRSAFSWKQNFSQPNNIPF